MFSPMAVRRRWFTEASSSTKRPLSSSNCTSRASSPCTNGHWAISVDSWSTRPQQLKKAPMLSRRKLERIWLLPCKLLNLSTTGNTFYGAGIIIVRQLNEDELNISRYLAQEHKKKTETWKNIELDLYTADAQSPAATYNPVYAKNIFTLRTEYMSALCCSRVEDRGKLNIQNQIGIYVGGVISCLKFLAEHILFTLFKCKKNSPISLINLSEYGDTNFFWGLNWTSNNEETKTLQDKKKA